MFDRIRRSASTVDAEQLKTQAAGIGAALGEASAQAQVAAAKLAEEARIAALHAKEWAGPRVEKAWRDGAKAATPKIEAAAERAVPMVDTAHDTFVEDVLPKLVAAVSAAATAAAAGADKARDATSAKLTEMAHLEVPEPEKKSHVLATIMWLLAGAAAAGAALAAWNRSKPTTDPWAEQPWEPVDQDPTDRFKAAAADVKYELGDAAEAVGEAAGETVARTRGATEKAAERAREAAEKAREATKKAAPRRRAGGAATPVLAGDEVTESIPTQEGTMSTEGHDSTEGYEGTGTAPGATDAPHDLPGTTEPLDSDKIPTDVPGQLDDPSHTAKGGDRPL